VIDYIKNRLSKFWPRHGLYRTIRFLFKKSIRISATPHAIAAGIAAGVFASFTPLIGFHFVLSFVIAYIIGGNMLAAGIGTIFGNPITFPFIWSVSYWVGATVSGDEISKLPKINLSNIWDSFLNFIPVLKKMMIGGGIVGFVIGLILYIVIYIIVSKFQKRRKKRKRMQKGV